MIDLFGHVAYILIFLGLWLVTRKRYVGWPIKLIGDALWVGIGAMLGMTSIMLWGSAFVLLDLWGWHKWGKDANQDK